MEASAGSQKDGATTTPPSNGGSQQRRTETASEVLDAVGRNQAAITAIVKAFGEEFTKARTSNVHVSKHLSRLVFAFMALIVAGCAILVFVGKMGDASLTFLIGIIIGYMMRFVDRLDFGQGGDE